MVIIFHNITDLLNFFYLNKRSLGEHKRFPSKAFKQILNYNELWAGSVMKFFHLVLYLMKMLNGKTTNLKVWWLVLQNTQCTVWLSPHLDGLRWWTCHCWPPRSQQSLLFSSALSNRKNCTDQTQHDLNQCSTVLGCPDQCMPVYLNESSCL